MKNINRVHRKCGAKHPSSQVQTGIPVNHGLHKLFQSLTPGRLPSVPTSVRLKIISASLIGKTLKLNRTQTKLLALFAEWEGKTPIGYCNEIVMALMQSSLDDMELLASQDERQKEKAWAQKFLPLVKPLFMAGGAQ